MIRNRFPLRQIWHSVDFMFEDFKLHYKTVPAVCPFPLFGHYLEVLLECEKMKKIISTD